MIGHNSRSNGLSQRVGWRMIAATVFAALLVWLITLAMLRSVVAQSIEPAQTTPASVEPQQPSVSDTNEEEVVSRRVLPQLPREAESPEFRDSADNNVSFPVDI